MDSMELTLRTGDEPAVVDITGEVAVFCRDRGDGLVSVFVPTPPRAWRSSRPAPAATATCWRRWPNRCPGRPLGPPPRLARPRRRPRPAGAGAAERDGAGAGPAGARHLAVDRGRRHQRGQPDPDGAAQLPGRVTLEALERRGGVRADFGDHGRGVRGPGMTEVASGSARPRAPSPGPAGGTAPRRPPPPLAACRPGGTPSDRAGRGPPAPRRPSAVGAHHGAGGSVIPPDARGTASGSANIALSGRVAIATPGPPATRPTARRRRRRWPPPRCRRRRGRRPCRPAGPR